MTEKEKQKHEYEIEGLRRMCKRKVKRGNKKVAKLAIKLHFRHLDSILERGRDVFI